jgi:putative ABC transport system substrate-binding protein
MPAIGYLGGGSPEASVHLLTAFRKGLAETGYSEGHNVTIEYRWAEGNYARLPELAADLVRHQVNVIAATSTPAAPAAVAATKTLPVVFSTASDPVAFGLVASIRRPGGNVTGVSSFNAELGTKRLEILQELLPSAVVFAVLVNSDNPLTEQIVTDFGKRARAGQQIEIVRANTNRDIDAAFLSMLQKRSEALVVSPDPLFTTRRIQILTLAARHAMPAIFAFREDAEAGGLMCYGASLTDQSRQAGSYVGRVLKGEKPAELPVLRATKFEFIINLQTASALGLTVPPTLLARADEVIE